MVEIIMYCSIGCKYKASTWYLNGSPMVVTLGQQYNVGEKPPLLLYCTLIYINRHCRATKHNNAEDTVYIVKMVVILYCHRTI